MPYPVELVVDWANAPDHTAQGFPVPHGARPITGAQAEITNIPTLRRYHTAGAPDASFTDKGLFGDRSYHGEESLPGLYRSDFNFASNSNSSARFENGCYDVSGDFAAGHTLVFTQTPDVNKMVYIRYIDAGKVAVCQVAGAPQNSQGDIFFYRKH